MIKKYVLAALAAGTLFGCATARTSGELLRARETLARAEASTASRYAKDELLLARQTLAQAEAAHREDDESLEARHLAYLAERRAILAMTEGNIEATHRAIAKAERTYAETEAQIRRDKEAALEATRNALDAEQVENEALEAQIEARDTRARAEERMKDSRAEIDVEIETED